MKRKKKASYLAQGKGVQNQTPCLKARGVAGVQRGEGKGGSAVSNTIVMAAVIRDHVQYAPRSDSFRFLHDLRS